MVGAEVGDVGHVRVQPPLLGARDVAAGGDFQRAEVAAELLLLLIGEVLVVEHQHGVPIHAGFQRRDLIARQRLGDVEAGDLAGEARASGR